MKVFVFVRIKKRLLESVKKNGESKQTYIHRLELFQHFRISVTLIVLNTVRYAFTESFVSYCEFLA